MNILEDIYPVFEVYKPLVYAFTSSLLFPSYSHLHPLSRMALLVLSLGVSPFISSRWGYSLALSDMRQSFFDPHTPT